MIFWRRKEKKETEPPKSLSTEVPPVLKVERSFTPEDIEKAKSELRLSTVEKDILGETVTHLYEAAAEGKITPEERDRLISKYKDQLAMLDSIVERNQRIISLHELEETRAELAKMFHDKFMEVNTKIEEFRRKLGLKTKETVELKLAPKVEREAKPSPPEKVSPPTPTPAPPPRKRTKADEELEKLREDLQKELEKLEQIELEA